MNIYVPVYLREIPVISQFVDIYNGYYRGGYNIKEKDSLEDYKESLKRDPVKYFVGMCLDEEVLGDTYDDIVNYISRMFTAVKGTKKVFDYMKKYLNDFLDIQGDPVYTGQYINITFGNIVLTDEEHFYTSLVNFLGALLLFEDLITNVGQLGLTIKDEITNYVAADVICYKEYEVEYEASN